jgi:hypothetical protein
MVDSVTTLSRPFGTAEAALREGQVGGNAEHHRIGQLARLLVELAHRGGTGRRVDAGKDVQNLALAGKTAQGNVGEILADQHVKAGAVWPFAENCHST